MVLTLESRKSQPLLSLHSTDLAPHRSIQDGGVTVNWGLNNADIGAKVSFRGMSLVEGADDVLQVVISKDAGGPNQRWILERI